MRLAHDWYDEPVPDNVRLGERSYLWSSFAFLHYRSRHPNAVTVGDDSGVYPPTCFELGPDGCVDIGRYCSLGGFVLQTDHRITIGDYVFVAYGVVIADSFAATPPTAGLRAPVTAPGIDIGSDVWIGANAAILGGARLGDGVVVGASTVVDFEVAPYSIVAGNPARIVGSAPPRGAAA